MKALMIAGDRSGSGKTSITLAIASILSRTMSVQAFKVGMDYIDPSYLSAATGRPCRNLDSFVMTRDELLSVYANGCQGAGIAIVEGVRGLFEGAESLGDAGSSASVARILSLPIILVVNARSITRSAAAIVKGFQSFDPGIEVAGVILNNVSGESHAEKASRAVEHYCGVPVLGVVQRLPELSLGMRHLGLVPFRECQDTREFRERIERITEEVEHSVDLAGVVSAARDTAPPPADVWCFSPAADRDVRIGIAYDHVFNFYYADLFDVLGSMGAEVEFFSPAGGDLPDADGYIIGGGYPELHASALSSNDAMRESLWEAAREGIPVYAECGGLMYLTREIVVAEGWEGHERETRYPLCGVFPGKTVMPSRRVVSYVEGESNGENPMGAARFRGHEFHYSEVVLPDGTHYAYRLERGRGIRDGLDGAVCGRTLGSYTHLHPVASRTMFRRFVAACRNEQDS